MTRKMLWRRPEKGGSEKRYAFTRAERRELADRHKLPPFVVRKLARDIREMLTSWAPIWQRVNAMEKSNRRDLDELRADVARLEKLSEKINRRVEETGLGLLLTSDERDALDGIERGAQAVGSAADRADGRIVGTTGSVPRGPQPDEARRCVVSAACEAWIRAGGDLRISRTTEGGDPAGPLLRFVEEVCKLCTEDNASPPVETLAVDVKAEKADRRAGQEFDPSKW